MKKQNAIYFTILLVWLQSSAILAQELLKEMEYQELSAERIILDNSFSEVSILIVESTIPKLMFGSTRGIKPGAVKEKEPGIWWVTLTPGVQLIDISASGYLPLKEIRHNFEKRRVWRLKVTPKQDLGPYGGFDEDRPEICLKYTPTSAEEKVYGGLDGNVMKVDFSSGALTFRPTSGKHTIRLNSQGRLWEKSYDLDAGETAEDQVVFAKGATERWDLQQPGGLYMTSTPTGAKVYLNQVENGITPLTIDEIQPGVYQIEVVKDLYLASSRSLEIKSNDYTNVNFDLTPNFGRLKISSDPAGAIIWINERQCGATPWEISEFNAGRYSLRLVQSLYYEQTDTFEIKPGGEFIQTYTLKPQFGKVTVTSNPPGADVTVDGILWGRTPITKDKVLSGSHQLKLTKEHYFDETTTIKLDDGQQLEQPFTLRSSVGRLTVHSNPPGAKVTLVELSRLLGQTPLEDLPIDPGTYTLRLEKELYEPYETGVSLTYGGSQPVDAQLQRSVGHLRVSTEPQGAKIFLDSQFQGESPTVLKDIPTGSYQIRLEKAGYDIQIGKVDVLRNESVRYSQTLGTKGTIEWRKRRNQAKLLAVALPGAGQFRSGQTVRGVLYSGGFIGTVVMAYRATQDHTEAKSTYDSEMAVYHQSQSQAALDRHHANARQAGDDMDAANSQLTLFLGGAAGVYLLQLTDSWLFGGGKKPTVKTEVGALDGDSSAFSLLPYTSLNPNCPKVGIIIRF